MAISPSAIATLRISFAFSIAASCAFTCSSFPISADCTTVTFMHSSRFFSTATGTCASSVASSCDRRSSSSTFSSFVRPLSIVPVNDTMRVLLRCCFSSFSVFFSPTISMNCGLSSGLYSSRTDISSPHTRISFWMSYAAVRFHFVPLSTDARSSAAFSCADCSFCFCVSDQSDTCRSWMNSSFDRHAVFSFRLWIFCLRAASSVMSATSGCVSAMMGCVGGECDTTVAVGQ
mmetsp:Transcript_2479/g.2709  ORF Transcript_2479/g.2709 Transcript_2479/m.2709 type:complete len:232 (-) Transcript_2479:12-707(-)